MRDSLRLLPGGRRLLVLAVPVLLGVGLVAGALLYAVAASPAALQPEVAGPDLGVPPPAGLLVDVVGAVNRPGLYRMNRGDRVYDAIAAAGGLTSDADPTLLPDMACRVGEVEQCNVPIA